jgi:parallel beta-helix repeat protein
MKTLILRLSAGGIICLFLLSLCSNQITATDMHLSYSIPLQSGGTMLYVGGTGPNNYTAIQEAIDHASSGDTVFVYHGFYAENIVIRTSIHLLGEDTNSTIVDGMVLDTVVSISADNTVLQGFTLQHAKNDIQHAGVEISPANNVQVSQNNIQDNGWLGISIHGPGTSKVTISSNIIRNNSYGVYCLDCPEMIVSANNISNNGEGLYLIGSSESQIINNTVVNRGLGLHIERSFDLLLYGNWVVDNANGAYIFNSTSISILANTIDRNRWYGLWLKDTSHCTVDENHISGNIDVGLFLESSFDTLVTNNTLWDNDNGIYLKDAAGNVFQKNNLRNYKLDASFVFHTLISRRNIWQLNYWERPRILPGLIPGIIKLQNIHIPVMDFDWFPLRQFPSSYQIAPLMVKGSILYVGGNGPNNYSSIQHAIDDAQQNDTIYVYNGTYYETIIINKSLRLIGENATTTILNGNGTRDIITIVTDYVTIMGFTVLDGHFNILINHSSNANITGNNITSGLHGVSVQNGCQYITISKNVFYENVYGIRIFSSTDVTVSSNYLQSFKVNAFYYGTTAAQGRHHWKDNYWGRPRYLPYPVLGKIRIGNFSLTWINVDWHPLTSPL